MPSSAHAHAPRDRTWDFYRITDNTISATAFKALAAAPKPGEREENETEKGLRVSDKGFLNTAVIQSQITYIDGEAGGMHSRCFGLELHILTKRFAVLRYRCVETNVPQKTLDMNMRTQRIPNRAVSPALVSPRDRIPPHLWLPAQQGAVRDV